MVSIFDGHLKPYKLNSNYQKLLPCQGFIPSQAKEKYSIMLNHSFYTKGKEKGKFSKKKDKREHKFSLVLITR
jgi:hypothetical protein